MAKKKEKLEGFDNIRQAAFDHEMKNMVWCKCEKPEPSFVDKSVCRKCYNAIKSHYKEWGLI